MTENEKELIQIIRESDDPAKAFIIALDIICRYIKIPDTIASASVD